MKPVRYVATCIPGLVLAVGIDVPAAQIYKWVDNAGNVIYSQKPPPAGVERETIEPETGRLDADGAVKELQERIDYLDNLQLQRRQQAREREAASEDMRKKQAACESAQSRLASLQNPRVNEVDAQGNRRRLSEEERLAGLNRVNKYLEENCR